MFVFLNILCTIRKLFFIRLITNIQHVSCCIAIINQHALRQNESFLTWKIFLKLETKFKCVNIYEILM